MLPTTDPAATTAPCSIIAPDSTLAPTPTSVLSFKVQPDNWAPTPMTQLLPTTVGDVEEMTARSCTVEFVPSVMEDWSPRSTELYLFFFDV